MPSTYSPNLRLELQAIGENRSTWGIKANNDFSLIEQAITGKSDITISDANVTLTATNGVTDEARSAILNFTGTLTAARTVTIPTVSKIYLASNSTTGGFAVNIKTSIGAAYSLPAGTTRIIYCDGTDTLPAITALAVSEGGTGASTQAGARTGLGLGTMATQDADAVAITGGTIGSSVTGVTQTVGDSSTKLATTAFVTGAIGGGTTGKLDLTGGTMTGEIKSTNATNYRITNGSYGTFQLNNGTDLYFMVTAAGDVDGTYNSLRPFRFSLSTGRVTLGNGVDVTGTVVASGDITAFSDRRIKTNLAQIENALDKIDRLTGYTYDRIDMGIRQTGLIAQDVQAVLPEAVSEHEAGLALAYGQLAGLFVEAIKELRAEIKALKGDA